MRRIEGFDKYNLECLVEFGKFMEKEIGIRIPRNKSVVGNNVFAHESGIHTAGVIKNPFTYEPYPPEIVGGKRTFLVGDSSGIEVLRFKVQEALNELMDVQIEVGKNDNRLREIQADIQKLYNEDKRVSCISDEEILGYVKKYFVFKPMLKKDMNRAEAEEGNNEDVIESRTNEIKPRMHDTID
jgi:isopropylmalate/homocitrate/citramalate synthase